MEGGAREELVQSLVEVVSNGFVYYSFVRVVLLLLKNVSECFSQPYIIIGVHMRLR